MRSQQRQQRREEDQEAVLARFDARLKQILIVSRERPVVVLTRAIDVLKGYSCSKAGKAVVSKKRSKSYSVNLRRLLSIARAP